MATQFNITITVDDAVANQLLNACSNIERATGTPITLDALISFAATATATNMPKRVPEKQSEFQYKGRTYRLDELNQLSRMQLALIAFSFGLYDIHEVKQWDREDLESYISYEVNEEYWEFFRFATAVEKHAKKA